MSRLQRGTDPRARAGTRSRAVPRGLGNCEAPTAPPQPAAPARPCLPLRLPPPSARTGLGRPTGTRREERAGARGKRARGRSQGTPATLRGRAAPPRPLKPHPEGTGRPLPPPRCQAAGAALPSGPRGPLPGASTRRTGVLRRPPPYQAARPAPVCACAALPRQRGSQSANPDRARDASFPPPKHTRSSQSERPLLRALQLLCLRLLEGSGHAPPPPRPSPWRYFLLPPRW